jgi:putative endonuclease
MNGYVYILSNKPNGTLYVGVTNDLVRRVHEHREKSLEGFSKKYGLCLLVYYELHATMPLAIQREKNIKHWVRRWKIELIEKSNPGWADLWVEITR